MSPHEFKRFRQRLGMTQVGMAEHLEVSERQIRAYERGEQAIPRPYAISLAADWHLICLDALDVARHAVDEASRHLMEELQR